MRASTAIISEPADQPTAAGRIQSLIPLGFFIVGAFIFFRWQIFSHFDLLFGDSGDPRLVTFLHEHVYRSLHGAAEFLSPPFFFNQDNTLGYSDAFLLDQVIYAPLRLSGAEPLLGTLLIPIVLCPVAYLFLYLLLRRLDVSVIMASLAAFAFTFANNLYLKSLHLQHFTVYYIPAIAYFGVLAVNNLHRRPFLSYLLAIFAAGLYGLLFSTGYYMAWFFGLALLISAPIAGFVAWRDVLAWWREHPVRVLCLGFLASLSFLAALSIFATIYVPVLAAGGTRNFNEYLVFAPTPIDIVNVGSENLVWSGLIHWLHLIRDDRLDFTEVSIALTPTVQLLLVVSVILAIRSGFWPNDKRGRISRAFVVGGVSVCALFYLLTIKTHNVSLFHVLYAVVPGAKAIRVGYRGMVVANLFAATAIGLTFSRIVRLAWHEPKPLIRRGTLAAVTALLSLMVIEQVNLSQRSVLSRASERAYFSRLEPIPHECRTFYAAPQANRPAPYVQVDAMMIALDRHLPTINGHSGVLPPGWDFYDTEAADYEQRARRWALKRGIAEGLCRADIDQGTWTQVARDLDWICAPGGCVHRISFNQSREFEIDLARDGNGASFTDAHWAEPESNGRWTDATRAALLFSVDARRDLSISISMRPLLSTRAPKLTAWIEANQCQIADIAFDLAKNPGPLTISGTIPSRCFEADGKVVLHINTDKARSPKEIGINNDPRRFGIWVERVTVHQSER